MNKKFIITVILSIFIIGSISSTIAKNSSLESSGFRLLSVDSEITLEPSEITINEPVQPGESKEIDFTVKYRVNSSKNLVNKLLDKFLLERRIGKFILFRDFRIDPIAEINLTIEENPDFCTASLSTSSVSIDISKEFVESETVTATVTIDEDAEAFEKGDIVIRADFNTPDKWGIASSSNQTTISVTSDYKPDLEYNTVDNIIIPPINETSIPINITNNGNDETIVNIEIDNPPNNWSISLDSEQVTIPIGMTKQVNLLLSPVEGFDNESISLKITSKSSYSGADVDEKYLEGKSLSFSILLSNDGSLDDEDDENGIPGFELLSLVICIGIVLLLMKKRQS